MHSRSETGPASEKDDEGVSNRALSPFPLQHCDVVDSKPLSQLLESPTKRDSVRTAALPIQSCSPDLHSPASTARAVSSAHCRELRRQTTHARRNSQTTSSTPPAQLPLSQLASRSSSLHQRPGTNSTRHAWADVGLG